MTNLDYWKIFVGEDSPETFMRNFGSMDPDLCIARFLEDRNHLYGVVNQGQWSDTFQAPEQFQRLTVEVYLRSFLEETREEWEPALEAKPPSIPRRYREKFDQDKYPPPPSHNDDADGVPADQSESSDSVDTVDSDAEQATAADDVSDAEISDVETEETETQDDVSEGAGAPQPEAESPAADPSDEVRADSAADQTPEETDTPDLNST